ncbi:hypothetical protein FB45DRAFT_872553 [Roridomyces roridus]|uniref:Uncharacterized protein n=1 Tax=Roridomyces roridus TaxID=1738132 RepID=A0AAD7FFH4_9AGAR|nr:hypothetical protein FB45DRAFT_872553 [Roridomyces roridus]
MISRSNEPWRASAPRVPINRDPITAGAADSSRVRAAAGHDQKKARNATWKSSSTQLLVYSVTQAQNLFRDLSREPQQGAAVRGARGWILDPGVNMSDRNRHYGGTPREQAPEQANGAFRDLYGLDGYGLTAARHFIVDPRCGRGLGAAIQMAIENPQERDEIADLSTVKETEEPQAIGGRAGRPIRERIIPGAKRERARAGGKRAGERQLILTAERTDQAKGGSALMALER